ncbi:MAG: M1 family peptidase [Actinophytocola sp.]|uniref:M1 family metallopeptidase n=1 Tax=Actinophytocola sp. TaxID=1872138 RepID=UPI0013285631|nr:M1 family metallopeptidase [Actinophytocola sp.]MPZ85864.1 M1 family peptidase [Actinophytocola sp.]
MRRSTRALVAGTVVGAVAVLFGPPAGAAGGVGAPGIGDSYYPLDGNGGYDVSHYDIRLSYQPATDLLSGSTTILARTTQDLSRFNLDFLLEVSSVRVNNVPATFATNAGELTVTPKAKLKKGTNITVVVRYGDTPEPYRLYGFAGWQRTPTGALGVNEPQIAPWWYPSNDHPLDKATFDVSIAAPEGVEALSNGALVSKQQQTAGMVRWNWRSVKPQAPYLTFLAIGQYEVREATAPNGQPVITAYGDDLGDSGPAARASVERTPEVIEVLEQNFGPYPFEAQGGVVDSGLGFALENQTRPVYDAAFFRAGANTSVVAHELTHQWFGDSVSVRDWKEIWLNEGFATYAEYLWSDYQGEGTPAEVAQFTYDSIPADDPFWQVLPCDPGPDNQFDDAVYDRGGMTLQALRTAVGDTAFFRILKTWAAKHKYGTATTAEFIALAERISGRSLDSLFTTWLYTQGKPPVGPNGATAKAAVAEPRSYDRIAETHRLLDASR